MSSHNNPQAECYVLLRLFVDVGSPTDGREPQIETGDTYGFTFYFSFIIYILWF